jgi:uracil-DNA glycosylase family 4
MRRIKVGLDDSVDFLRGAAEDGHKAKLQQLKAGEAIYPLDAPGLSPFPPNSAFVSYVRALGDELSEVFDESVEQDGKTIKQRKIRYSTQLSELVKKLLYEPTTLSVSVGPHQEKLAKFVPGHLWGEEHPSGPRKADVMIINKNPWSPEEQAGRCLVDQEGKLLQNIFRTLKVENFNDFYVTHLVKFRPPDGKKVLKAVWIKDCLHLLQQEIKIVQPKYILCLGADATKALLGKTLGVSELEGRVEVFEYNTAFTDTEIDFGKKTAKVMTVVHPKPALRDPAALRQLENGLSRFSLLLKDTSIGVTEEVRHEIVDNHYDLLELLLEIEPELESNVIAVDAEWHGNHPVNAGSYLRTIQFAWAPKCAVGIKLHEPGGDVTSGFAEEPVNSRGISEKSIALLNKFFNGGSFEFDGQQINFRKKRIVGHFFNADLEWLLAYGLKLQEGFCAPLKDLKITEKNKSNSIVKKYLNAGFVVGSQVPAWFRTKYEGGADTGLMAHAIEETASYRLETLAMRYTTAPRYDQNLQKWRTGYCQHEGFKSGDLEGYGMCPDDILLPYGIYDADVTLRLFYKLDLLLDEDYEGNSCREAFWESQIATPSVLEIHQTGITVDRERVDHLTRNFMKARETLETELKNEIKWPDFNIRSTQHVREFLFGHELNGKLDKTTGVPVRIRPSGAFSLKLTPLFDTGKPPKPWREIQLVGKELDHAPSTNKQVLSLMANNATTPRVKALINKLRDYRFLDQVLKTVLRPPAVDLETSEIVFDDDGNYSYSDGLASMVCDDGKVRTHIYQTKETGRWSSARPNLQNISKQRDPDYKRLLGDDYSFSLRSVLKASPGHVLVEADYVGAELFGMAVMSGDKNMIEHAIRNQLPESHPDFYDIHSNVAVFAFRLDCPPTKSGLEAIGKKHIRIVAKSVIFGIAYGRGAKAIALAAREQGIEITDGEAQDIIDAIFKMYPKLLPFFNECKERAQGIFYDPNLKKTITQRYLCNCFGRFRRFSSAHDDPTLAAEFSRQAMNFPIQSMIASAVSRALAYLYDYKKRQLDKGEDMFKILLQIHDAILLEVPYKYVKHVCEFVLPSFMRKAVPIYQTDLNGMPTGVGPFYLGIESEVMNHWGELLSQDFAEGAGLPTGKKSIDGCVINYSQ